MSETVKHEYTRLTSDNKDCKKYISLDFNKSLHLKYNLHIYKYYKSNENWKNWKYNRLNK